MRVKDMNLILANVTPGSPRAQSYITNAQKELKRREQRRARHKYRRKFGY